MNENETDGALERLFQEAFSLTWEQEDAFLRRFEARRQNDGQVWETFTAIMIGLNARLRPAVNCLPRTLTVLDLRLES